MSDINPGLSWNKFVESLMLTKKAWELHRDVMEGKPDIELYGIEVSRRLRYPEIHRASSFDKALRSMLERWRVSGGLEAMLIPGIKEEKEKVKETKHGSRSK